MSSLLRIAYRAIIRLHPAAFRARFGEEMLWIFDEEACNGGTAHLLLDGLRSIALQHAKPRPAHASDPFYREINFAPPARRLAQAGLAILSVIFCFVLILSSWLPGPKLAAPAYVNSKLHPSEQKARRSPASTSRLYSSPDQQKYSQPSQIRTGDSR